MLFTIISIAVIFANMYFTQSALPCELTPQNTITANL